MTNQLTSTDTTTSTAVRPPTRTTTSDTRKRPLRPSGRRRWILIAGSAALVATAAIGLAATGDDTTGPAEPKAEQRPAYLIIQDEIEAALAEAAVSDGSFDAAEANRMETLRDLNAAQAQAASRTGARPGLPDGYWQPSQTEPAVSDGSFDTAEANRMETLRDLNMSSTPVCTLTGPC